MDDFTVEIDDTVTPQALRFAPVFNVAVPFIDRHLDAGRGGRDAIRTVDETVSYAELAERVNRCGNLLIALGVGRGDRLLMVVKDCPAFLYLFFGAIKAGVIPVPVNTMLRAADYRFMVDDSQCRALVYSAEFADTMAQALADPGHTPADVLCVEGDDGVIARMDDQPVALSPAPATAMDDCFWLYSSGSTGNPKGVVHRHRAMVCTGQRASTVIHGLGQDDVCFSVSKLFHSYGFGNALTFPLWAGATMVLSDRRTSPEMAFEMIERFRPTVFYGVPTLYAQQLHYLDRLAPATRPDTSSLRLCVSAGEALPGDVFRRWKAQTGTLILDGLGSTEMLHIFITNRVDDYRPGTSGRVVSGYEVRIVDEAGERVAPGEIGTVHVKGESAARCYWNNPDKTAATMLGDWLNTGDMYYQDADGYFVNCGRGDDMMKVGALWCSPFEIEGRLIEHPKVLEAAVVGHNDEEGLLKPAAYVVLNDPTDAGEEMAEALRAHCREALAHYKYPRWFHFVETLPKTATGKIQRFRLRG
jgi:benzoate-CoA ligase family protein